jgi:acyl transferase domain-containing protein
MRSSITRLALLLLAPTLALSVLAAGNVRYKWRDAEGNLHYSDSLPAEAGVHGYDVINAQGVLVKRVEPAMTAEEKAVAKAEAAQERAEKDATERQLRNDQQLLAANPTEADLRKTQAQQIEMIDLQIKSVQTGLQSLERSLTDLLGRAADLERSETAVPERLNTQISDLRGKINAQYALLERSKAERAKTLQGFDAEVERYRALQEKYKQH